MQQLSQIKPVSKPPVDYESLLQNMQNGSLDHILDIDHQQSPLYIAALKVKTNRLLKNRQYYQQDKWLSFICAGLIITGLLAAFALL